MKKIIVFFSFFAVAQQLTAQQIEDKYPISILNPSGTKQLLFYFSGDGGINNFSENLCNDLAKKNYPVLIFNSRKYFWKQKLPNIMAPQVSEIIQYYLAKLNKKEFSIIGYSFGADVAIYYNTRLPKNLTLALKSTVLLSPSMATDFTIKLSDLLGMDNAKGEYKTLPEILKSQTNTLCVFGEDEDKQFYNGVANKKNIKRILLPGSHKYSANFDKVSAAIVTGL